ncbi:tetraacyldisaccharide 4'-kinase [Sulfurospirillum sp. 1612]|uniref:tetraacyldisaccharide 4'-kinase n=1 Tax=Sulfurospirillum sp. 1612 TaxID=3094835 RepID=UPI002F94A286
MFNKAKITLWIETYLFYPSTLWHYLLALILLPLSIIYSLIVICKRVCAKQRDFGVAIISIGNLTLGGSGKTPLTIEIAKHYDHVAIILRGFGRQTQGMKLVAHNHKIYCDVFQSGDEAMEYATSLPHATVIVSEDRSEAIQYAKSLGCNIILLDDGFSKAYIKKFDILIRPKREPKLPFCIPSGAYREPIYLYHDADLVLQEDVDFKRVVNIENATEQMVLVTGISKPNRLDEYLPKNLIGKVYFEDHHAYHEEELSKIMSRFHATSILTTTKDAVKMEAFGFNLSIMKLNIEIKQSAIDKINAFLANFR